MPFSFSNKVINSFFDVLVDGLLTDGIVKISNFGKFKVIKKKQRIGRNPKTMEVCNINARKVVIFHPSKFIKKKINEKEEQPSL